MMTRFLDGPAVKAELALRRAPLLLRVVFDSRTFEFDALDQLDDRPKASEKIFVYRRIGEANRIHIKSSCKSLNGFFESGEYKILEQQPADDVARETAAWRQWATDRLETACR